MWNEIYSIVVSNGIFACLFVALLFFELKDSRSREKKYQQTIDTLSVRLKDTVKIKEDIEEIKDVVIYKKRKVNEKL